MVQSWDLIILGRGILGAALAYQSAKTGSFPRIKVLYEPSDDGLNADTLRNHSWWQSGLLYDDTTVFAAANMFASGFGLHENAGVSLPTLRGLFRLDPHREAEFLERVKRLRLEQLVDPVRDEAARGLLGPFFVRGFAHYQVPDTTFDEARVLSRLMARARDLDVSFEPARVDLIREPTVRAGFLIKAESQILEAANTVICCGAGTPRLLNTLGLEHPLVVFQSPLLILRCGFALGVPLFADLTQGYPFSGLTAVSHGPTKEDPQGCLVVGDRGRKPLVLTQVHESGRQVELAEASALEARLPGGFPLPPRGPLRRFTAGWKTEAARGNKSSVEPWIGYWPDQFPGLIAAIPGKATLAHYTARVLLKTVLSATGSGPLVSDRGVVDQPSPDPLLRPHHHVSFNLILNDLENELDR